MGKKSKLQKVIEETEKEIKGLFDRIGILKEILEKLKKSDGKEAGK